MRCASVASVERPATAHLQMVTTPGTVHFLPGTTVIVKPPEAGRDGFVDFFTGGLLVATVALAVYTAQLRKATVDLAGDTIQGTKLSDRHHQESLSPVCVVRDVKCGSGESYNSDPGRLGVVFKVHNMGSGPALLVNVTVTPVKAGLVPNGLAVGSIAYSLAAGETQDHRFGNFAPRENAMFVIEVQCLSIFNTWGVGKWNVWKGEGTYGVVTFDLPSPLDRVGATPPPGPLSGQNYPELGKPKDGPSDDSATTLSTEETK